MLPFASRLFLVVDARLNVVLSDDTTTLSSDGSSIPLNEYVTYFRPQLRPDLSDQHASVPVVQFYGRISLGSPPQEFDVVRRKKF